MCLLKFQFFQQPADCKEERTENCVKNFVDSEKRKEREVDIIALSAVFRCVRKSVRVCGFALQCLFVWKPPPICLLSTRCPKPTTDPSTPAHTNSKPFVSLTLHNTHYTTSKWVRERERLFMCVSWRISFFVPLCSLFAEAGQFLLAFSTGLVARTSIHEPRRRFDFFVRLLLTYLKKNNNKKRHHHGQRSAAVVVE